MEVLVFFGEVVRLWSYDEKNVVLLKFFLKDFFDDLLRSVLVVRRGKRGRRVFFFFCWFRGVSLAGRLGISSFYFCFFCS